MGPAALELGSPALGRCAFLQQRWRRRAWRSGGGVSAVLSTSRSTSAETSRVQRAGDERRRLGVIVTERRHYAVEFQKGLSFPDLGLSLNNEDFTVDRIEAQSFAAFSQIQVGDRLRMVSSPAIAATNPLEAAISQQDRVRLVFERPSIREWEQQMEEAEEAQEAAAVSGARMGVSCSAAAASTSGTDAAAVGVGRCMVTQFSRPQQAGLRRGASPRAHREQASLLCSLIRQASELPPIPLSHAPQQRWSVEFEGDNLKTYRRVSDDRWALARGGAQPLPGASNILPLPCWLQPGGFSGSTSAAPNPVGVPAWASCVLPWLIMATGQLGTRDIETVATTCGLTRLLDLDLDSPRLHSTAASGEARTAGVLAIASQSPRHEEPLALARAAAALQRLVVRRGGVDAETDPVELCCILVHTARASGETALATLLAAWLHWFGRLELQQALQEADNAVGAPPDASAIAAGSKLLLDGWRERARAVTLTWPYGGASVEVAGDVLGGWHVRAPLDACNAAGCTIQIRGLQPGRYPYKFIVDGMWVVDMALPAECDAEGNTNNVVVIADDSPDVLPPADALLRVRLEAARLAMASKLGIGVRRQRAAAAAAAAEQ